MVTTALRDVRRKRRLRPARGRLRARGLARRRAAGSAGARARPGGRSPRCWPAFRRAAAASSSGTRRFTTAASPSGSSAWARTAARFASATTSISTRAGWSIATGSTRRGRAPRRAADPVPEVAEELFASLGEIAERTTLASSGWSGNRIDRLVLADGRALIAKRIVPGSDWLGRATHDPGREALLFADGVFARMPASVDPAVVAAEPDGDAWWVVMRDVSAELLDESTPLTRDQNRFVLGPRRRDVGAVLGRGGAAPVQPRRPPGVRGAGDLRAGARRRRHPAEAVRGSLGGVRRGGGSRRGRGDPGAARRRDPARRCARRPRHDADPRRPARREHRAPGRAARAPRLRPRDPGQPRARARLVHGPRRLADRGEPRRGRRGLPPRARRARRSRWRSSSA